MKTLLTKLEGAELRAAILQCIRDGFTLTAQISERLAVTSDKVSTRLDYLRTLGVIHGVRVSSPKGGFVNEWHMGPALDEYGQPGHVHKGGSRAQKDGLPHVVVSTTYPLVDRRDPLVAALFGAPVVERRALQQSAPCCTRCHMEQGAGYQAGCIVAMVAA
jgi:hypothetical protein